MKTIKIKKGLYKITFNNKIIYASKYDDGTWGLYEDEKCEEWIDTMWRTPTLKSCKKVIEHINK